MRAGPAAAVLSALAVMGLAACGSPYPGATLGQQVSSWAKVTGFSSSLRTLRKDAGNLPALEARGDVKALHTSCDVLVNDALGANQNLPTPDSVLTAVLAAAYQSAAAAGRDCIKATVVGSPQLAGTASQLAGAEKGYVKAQARLDDLGATAG